MRHACRALVEDLCGAAGVGTPLALFTSASVHAATQRVRRGAAAAGATAPTQPVLERGVALNDALQLARLAAPTTTPHAAAELLRRCLQEQSGVAIDTIAAAARGASSGDSGGIVGTAGFAWHTTKGGLGHVTPRQLSTAIVTQSQSQLQQYVA